MRLVSFALLAMLSLLVASCAAAPADVAGTYTATLTNGPNTCNVSGWTVGDRTNDVPVTITQSGSNVTVLVEGLAGVYLDVAVGGKTFTGTVVGNRISAQLVGSRAQTTGNCGFNFVLNLQADLTGNALNGALDWSARTNGASDCGAFASSCANTQTLVASRPPR